MAQARRTELIGHLPLERPARAPRRHMRWRKLVAVALGTLAILAASYLVVANVLLRTRLLRNLISRNAAVLQLDYESAYSIIPGRVRVEGLSIRGRGRTVEWFLTLDRADAS